VSVKRRHETNMTVCVSILSCRSFKKPYNKAAASEIPRHAAEYVEGLSDARTQLWGFFKLLPSAEVVKWQTRTFEGRVAQAMARELSFQVHSVSLILTTLL
jgi:hypothetical protein